MASAFFWGLVSALSLVVGGLLASWVTLGKRTLGLIMGFGAGVLLSAVAYELVYESVHIAKLSGFPALGFFAGAFTFFFADLLVGRMGGEPDETADGAQSALIVPLVLGAASAAGYALLGGVSAHTLAVVQSFAGGAILMMLANTMRRSDRGWPETEDVTQPRPQTQVLAHHHNTLESHEELKHDRHLPASPRSRSSLHIRPIVPR